MPYVPEFLSIVAVTISKARWIAKAGTVAETGTITIDGISCEDKKLLEKYKNSCHATHVGDMVPEIREPDDRLDIHIQNLQRTFVFIDEENEKIFYLRLKGAQATEVIAIRKQNKTNPRFILKFFIFKFSLLL